MELRHLRYFCSVATNLSFCPLLQAGAKIGLVMAWSPHREAPVLYEFLKLVRNHPNWPRHG